MPAEYPLYLSGFPSFFWHSHFQITIYCLYAVAVLHSLVILITFFVVATCFILFSLHWMIFSYPEKKKKNSWFPSFWIPTIAQFVYLFLALLDMWRCRLLSSLFLIYNTSVVLSQGLWINHKSNIHIRSLTESSAMSVQLLFKGTHWTVGKHLETQQKCNIT